MNGRMALNSYQLNPLQVDVNNNARPSNTLQNAALSINLHVGCVGWTKQLCVLQAGSVLSAILNRIYVTLDAVTIQQSFSRWQHERRSQQNESRADLLLMHRNTSLSHVLKRRGLLFTIHPRLVFVKEQDVVI